MGYAAKLGSSDSKKLNRINLGTSNSINISTHEVLGPIYNKLTIDNFGAIMIAKNNTYKYYGNSTGNASLNRAVSLAYNATTGVLTTTTGRLYAWAGSQYGAQYFDYNSTKYCLYLA